MTTEYLIENPPCPGCGFPLIAVFEWGCFSCRNCLEEFPWSIARHPEAFQAGEAFMQRAANGELGGEAKNFQTKPNPKNTRL
jgi:hypothetical protein